MKCSTIYIGKDGKPVHRMKIKYTNKMFAIAAMRRMRGKEKSRVKYYKCPKCGFYHIGKTNNYGGIIDS